MTQIRADQVQPGMLVPGGLNKKSRLRWTPGLVIAVEQCPPGWPDGWVRITTCRDDGDKTMHTERLPPDWLVEVLDNPGRSKAA